MIYYDSKYIFYFLISKNYILKKIFFEKFAIITYYELYLIQYN